MAVRLTLKKLAENLIKEARAPFSAEDFSHMIRDRWGRKISSSTLDRLTGRLAEHKQIIGLESNDFLPYRAVLDKIVHIPMEIPISSLELHEKILIPGYRLIPVISTDLDEENLTLLDPNGNEIPKKKKKFLLEEIIQFYQYSNAGHFPDHININEQIPGKSSLSVTVWQMEEVFKSFQTKPCRSLLIKLIDYDLGIMQVHPQCNLSQNQNKLKARSLNIALEQALLDYLNRRMSPSEDLEKQLLRAFYTIDPKFLDVLSFSVKNFLESAQKVSVVGCEWGQPRFVSASNSNDLAFHLEISPKKSLGRSGSLDEIFEDLGLPFGSIEFTAILRAVLTRKTCSLEVLVDMLFSGKGDLFHNSKQEDRFYQLLRDMMIPLYKEMEEPEPKTIAELRAQAVSVKLRLIKSLKFLEFKEIGLADLPFEILDQIIEMDQFCAESLIFFEESQHPIPIQKIKDIQLALKIVGPKLSALEEEIYNDLSVF
jgi:hypothetical protein